MAAAVVFDTPVDVGRSLAFPNYLRRGTINLGVYATGGIAVTKTTFELPVRLDDLQVAPTGGYTFEWDKTNAKVLAYSGSSQVADTTDITTTVARFRAVGR